MNDDTLLTIIKQYRKDALGPDDGALTTERAEAMDRYHGRPYGTEEPNKSSIVTKDLSETVDWIMPWLNSPPWAGMTRTRQDRKPQA